MQPSRLVFLATLVLTFSLFQTVSSQPIEKRKQSKQPTCGPGMELVFVPTQQNTPSSTGPTMMPYCKPCNPCAPSPGAAAAAGSPKPGFPFNLVPAPGTIAPKLPAVPALVIPPVAAPGLPGLPTLPDLSPLGGAKEEA
ncbi:hypothetical protein G6F56_011228 [Rhizopus delemar]|nr:hypothetical protein G6F56_011228 [Rhizopus delemar]